MSQKTLEDLENYGELLLKTTLIIASLTLWKQSVKKNGFTAQDFCTVLYVFTLRPTTELQKCFVFIHVLDCHTVFIGRWGRELRKMET